VRMRTRRIRGPGRAGLRPPRAPDPPAGWLVETPAMPLAVVHVARGADGPHD